MKKSCLLLLLLSAALLSTATIATFAQASMSSWPFFAPVTPQSGAAGTYNLIVPLAVMDKAREDLADLRLLDASGREIPYALRIRKEIDDKQEVGVSIFNEARIGSASEVSVDLGENAGQHNEVEIDTGA